MKYTSADGLLSSNDREAVAHWNKTGEDMARDTAQWTSHLRSLGVKLAHPDDGWVDRDRNIATPCYPQFDDRPEVGDTIALGYGWGKHWGGDFHYRLCRVTEVEEWGVIARSLRYHFTDTGERL